MLLPREAFDANSILSLKLTRVGPKMLYFPALHKATSVSLSLLKTNWNDFSNFITSVSASLRDPNYPKALLKSASIGTSSDPLNVKANTFDMHSLTSTFQLLHVIRVCAI